MLRFLILLLFAVPAAAGPPAWVLPVLNDGLAAHARGDYSRAGTDFARLAAHGSAIAETMLGAMHARGQGVRRDPAVAATWWLRAASRGYAPAQLALAEAYAAGHGVERDPEAAWVWARLAAMRGDTPTSVRAEALAAALGKAMDPPARARLEQRRLAWRPWATLPE